MTAASLSTTAPTQSILRKDHAFDYWEIIPRLLNTTRCRESVSAMTSVTEKVMDWWSEDAFGNECWSIGLERSDKTVNPTIKQESNEQAGDNFSLEVRNNFETYSSHEDDVDAVKDDISHKDTSGGSVIVLGSDPSKAACDITFPKIKTEVTEECLKKEYEEITISEEQIVSESPEECDCQVAVLNNSKPFKTGSVTDFDLSKSSVLPGSTADVQLRSYLHKAMTFNIAHDGDISSKSCGKMYVENRKREKPYSCALCFKKYFSKNNLKTHIHAHTTGRSFFCSVCSANFPRNDSVNKHMRTHTGEKPFSCLVCDKKFSQRGHLNIHMRTHTQEKPFSCSVCDVKFSLKAHLMIHMRIHTGEKPYSCSVCSAKFSVKCTLKIHMRTHTREKPFSCSLCNMKFTQKGHLKNHMRIHTGEKPHSCLVCSIKFSRKWSLKLHMRTHTREKPFSCSVCDVKCSQKSALKSHMHIHTCEKSYSCSICSANFSHKGNLKNHMHIHMSAKPL
ncbi:zinc finger protein OZF-like isoform X1 [Bacillus rossius redtenbacheri]|uniref:zinc finger protein OZF-like isoform X1 n=2 Tax=Bacillus rossius redtenbacheri TaxID=93214 RepID=UPI002FDEC514